MIGQKLNVEAVPDDESAMRSVADPGSGLVESGDGSNDDAVCLEKCEDELEEIKEPL